MKKRSKRFPNRPQLLVGNTLVYGLSENQIGEFYQGVRLTMQRREKFMTRFTFESEATLKARAEVKEAKSKKNSANVRRWRANKAARRVEGPSAVL